ncbi:SAM11 protein, partial [Atractosteus spatula]|nr:SAM11 protein [Atractosteus spatula]
MPAIKKERLEGEEMALAAFNQPEYLAPLNGAAMPVVTPHPPPYDQIFAHHRAYLMHEAALQNPPFHGHPEDLVLERFSSIPDFQPFFDNGEPCIEVECGENKALLYISKLCQGSKGPSIKYRGEWLTPNEFQFVSGRETAKDWKRSIRHKGKSLKTLMSKGILQVHPPICDCPGCRISSPVNRGRLAEKRTIPLPPTRIPKKELASLFSSDDSEECEQAHGERADIKQEDDLHVSIMKKRNKQIPQHSTQDQGVFRNEQIRRASPPSPSEMSKFTTSHQQVRQSTREIWENQAWPWQIKRCLTLRLSLLLCSRDSDLSTIISNLHHTRQLVMPESQPSGEIKRNGIDIGSGPADDILGKKRAYSPNSNSECPSETKKSRSVSPKENSQTPALEPLVGPMTPEEHYRRMMSALNEHGSFEEQQQRLYQLANSMGVPSHGELLLLVSCLCLLSAPLCAVWSSPTPELSGTHLCICSLLLPQSLNVSWDTLHLYTDNTGNRCAQAVHFRGAAAAQLCSRCWGSMRRGGPPVTLAINTCPLQILCVRRCGSSVCEACGEGTRGGAAVLSPPRPRAEPVRHCPSCVPAGGTWSPALWQQRPSQGFNSPAPESAAGGRDNSVSPVPPQRDFQGQGAPPARLVSLPPVCASLRRLVLPHPRALRHTPVHLLPAVATVCVRRCGSSVCEACGEGTRGGAAVLSPPRPRAEPVRHCPSCVPAGGTWSPALWQQRVRKACGASPAGRAHERGGGQQPGPQSHSAPALRIDGSRRSCRPGQRREGSVSFPSPDSISSRYFNTIGRRAFGIKTTFTKERPPAGPVQQQSKKEMEEGRPRKKTRPHHLLRARQEAVAVVRNPGAMEAHLPSAGSSSSQRRKQGLPQHRDAHFSESTHYRDLSHPPPLLSPQNAPHIALGPHLRPPFLGVPSALCQAPGYGFLQPAQAEMFARQQEMLRKQNLASKSVCPLAWCCAASHRRRCARVAGRLEMSAELLRQKELENLHRQRLMADPLALHPGLPPDHPALRSLHDIPEGHPLREELTRRNAMLVLRHSSTPLLSLGHQGPPGSTPPKEAGARKSSRKGGHHRSDPQGPPEAKDPLGDGRARDGSADGQDEEMKDSESDAESAPCGSVGPESPSHHPFAPGINKSEAKYLPPGAAPPLPPQPLPFGFPYTAGPYFHADPPFFNCLKKDTIGKSKRELFPIQQSGWSAMGGLFLDGEEAGAVEDISKWTVDDVCSFVSSLSGCSEYTQVFREQAIDGETLPLLTEEHLLNNMGLKLGPALKIRSQVPLADPRDPPELDSHALSGLDSTADLSSRQLL